MLQKSEAATAATAIHTNNSITIALEFWNQKFLPTACINLTVLYCTQWWQWASGYRTVVFLPKIMGSSPITGILCAQDMSSLTFRAFFLQWYDQMIFLAYIAFKFP